MRLPTTPTRAARRLVAVLVLTVVGGFTGAAAGTPPASATVTTLATLTTTGSHEWIVPTGVTNVTFDVYGASGGNVVYNNHGFVTLLSSGGAGGEAKARLAVKPGEVFNIFVGGQGGLATVGKTTGSPGINGGGFGDSANIATHVSGGGGGASDVRIGGHGNPCAQNLACAYVDRIVVAGGGGGGSDSGTNGDAGGGVTGGGTVCPSVTGESGTQTCGGEAFNCSGQFGSEAFGSFGGGGRGCDGTGWGGGGGGWYGGASQPTAGGGSGYISSLAKSGSFPGGTRQGDGEVIITTTT